MQVGVRSIYGSRRDLCTVNTRFSMVYVQISAKKVGEKYGRWPVKESSTYPLAASWISFWSIPAIVLRRLPRTLRDLDRRLTVCTLSSRLLPSAWPRSPARHCSRSRRRRRFQPHSIQWWTCAPHTSAGSAYRWYSPKSLRRGICGGRKKAEIFSIWVPLIMIIG